MHELAIHERRTNLVADHRRAASIPAALFGFFSVFYALTSAGRLDSADGVVVAAASRSLLHGSLAIPSYVGESVVGVGGLSYSRYGIGQSIVELPFAALGTALGHLTHRADLFDWSVAFTNTFVTALGGALFYLLLRALGSSQRRGVVLTLIYGLCTLVWPFAKSDFSEPLQTACLIGATLAAVYWRKRNEPRWLLLAGACLAGMILTKALLIIAVPAFSLFLIVSDLSIDGGISLHPLRRGEWWLNNLRAQCLLWSGPLVACVITVWLNLARFGSPFDFGYGRMAHDALFSVPVPVGVFGMLFSFNSGLIFYSTPVVLGVLGYKRFVQQRLPEAVLIGAVCAVFLVFYGGYYYWAGQAAFGPRYIVPLVPLLLLPAVYAGFGVRDGKVMHRGVVVLVCVVLGLGFLEQLSGVLVSFDAPFALTCVNVPCGPSLDPTQSELLYNIWLAPTVIAYNFFGQTPHVILATYPFGLPPIGRANWPTLLLDRMRYFWFLPLPYSKAVGAVGAILGLSGLFFLARRIRHLVDGRAPEVDRAVRAEARYT